MKLDTKKIKEILVQENYLTAEDFGKAEKYAIENHSTIFEYLLRKELISRKLLGLAVSEHYKIPFADLETKPASAKEIAQLPEAVAREFHAIVQKADAHSVIVATDEPDNPNLLKNLHDVFPKRNVTISYTFPDAIDSLFRFYKKPLETRFSEIINSQTKVAPEIIGEIIRDAVSLHASDIHFEPNTTDVIVRFRIDGILHEAGKIPKEFYGNILNRIKVQSNMRIDEHFAAQDGAIRFRDQDKSLDVRVSVIPTLDGEKIAIRLLAQYIRDFTFSDLGLTEHYQNLLKKQSKKPFGMILVTGPTGSGKTTTLYALLQILNSPDVNITTIEDPVEYKIDGVNQIQVNEQTNLTFAKGLRSIVRQDPDIILVGEIRDLETAEISVNAALTGHLLLSTFHANDATAAIPRLLDMGVEPFLLSSTLNVIVAQRLVRKICETCRFSYTETADSLKKIEPSLISYLPKKNITLYKGKGCKSCNGTGFKGRIAIFEAIEMTIEIQDFILKNPSSNQIWELARKQGSLTLFEDGMEKVKNGTTTLDEVIRVAPPPRIKFNAHVK